MCGLQIVLGIGLAYPAWPTRPSHAWEGSYARPSIVQHLDNFPMQAYLMPGNAYDLPDKICLLRFNIILKMGNEKNL